MFFLFNDLTAAWRDRFFGSQHPSTGGSSMPAEVEERQTTRKASNCYCYVLI